MAFQLRQVWSQLSTYEGLDKMEHNASGENKRGIITITKLNQMWGQKRKKIIWKYQFS